MARYEQIPTDDPNWSVITDMALVVKGYIVTWSNVVSGARKIFANVRTQAQAFRKCREAADRSVRAFPLCFFKVGLDVFKVVADNIFTH